MERPCRTGLKDQPENRYWRQMGGRCPKCGSRRTRATSTPGRIQYRKCNGCGEHFKQTREAL